MFGVGIINVILEVSNQIEEIKVNPEKNLEIKLIRNSAGKGNYVHWVLSETEAAAWIKVNLEKNARLIWEILAKEINRRKNGCI